MNDPNIEQYMFLIREFVRGSLGANHFEAKYMDLFKSDETIREEKFFLVLDKLFSDVDAFCSERTIRKTGNLDENGLRDSARNAYEKLIKLF